jgi:hypothetical protein
MTDLRPTARRFGPGKIIAVVLVALAIFGIALFFILKTALGPLVDAGDAFMGALRDGDYEQARTLAAPDLQRMIGIQELSASVTAYRPASWSWSQRSDRNGTGYLSGSVTYRAGNHGTAELRLTKVDGSWRVTAYRFN